MIRRNTAGSHIIALTATFHADHLRLLLDWAARARAEVEAWPDTAGQGLTAEARRMIEQTLRRGERDLGRQPGPAQRA